MYTINFPIIATLSGQTFQTRTPVVVDDELYAQIDALNTVPATLQEWQDLSITTTQAIQQVNSYLNGRYLGNHTDFYLHNPIDSTQPTAQLGFYTHGYTQLGINITQLRPATGRDDLTEIVPTDAMLLNAVTLDNLQRSNLCRYASYNGTDISNVWAGSYNSVHLQKGATLDTRYITVSYAIAPSDFFVDNLLNPAYVSSAAYKLGIEIHFDANADFDITAVRSIKIFVDKIFPNTMVSAFNGLDIKGATPDIDDYSNPYSSDGTAGPGGGDGTLPGSGLDSIDPAEIPDLPAISAANLGFITMYNPTAAQLKSLSDFMWSGAFDLATYKKLFSDPMQSIIGLSIVPVAPSIGGSKNVHFGTIDSGISMSYLSTNYVQLDCGSVALEKYVGCFMDNDPYTKISIYLPFVGIRQLSADDVIGGSIHVVYNIDVLTGACACFIEHSTRGVLYSYNGSCITNVPLTAVNFSGAIQNAVTAVGSALGIAAGMATGAAPITAMSAVGLMTSAANTALNSKPQVQRSGNLGGSAGILSIMTPYVIIERPALSVPNNVQKYVGQTSNITMSLGGCRGFTMCEYVHIDNVSATTEEITEIESMLKQGVIL